MSNIQKYNHLNKMLTGLGHEEITEGSFGESSDSAAAFITATIATDVANQVVQMVRCCELSPGQSIKMMDATSGLAKAAVRAIRRLDSVMTCMPDVFEEHLTVLQDVRDYVADRKKDLRKTVDE